MAEDPRSDQQLIEAANAGDADAFQALYLRYRDWSLRVAQRVTRDPDEALDALQDVWVYVLRKFPGFQLSARMTTFLYPVIQHVSLGVVRRRKRGQLLAAKRGPQAEARESPSPASEMRDDLAAALSALPPGQADVLLLRFVDDLSLDAIAEALAIPVGTVKSRLHHALETLRCDPGTRRFFEIK